MMTYIEEQLNQDDEQLEQLGRVCFCKRFQPRILKHRPKHPIKLHIWGGISVKGATKLVMCTGIMNARHLGTVYEADLVPFIQERFPDGHRLYQDNDPNTFLKIHWKVFVRKRFELVVYTTRVTQLQSD